MVESNLTGAIIGAAIQVHRALGPGFVEGIYERALAIELRAQGIAFGRQTEVAVSYRGQIVGIHRVDLFVERSVIVELKVARELVDAHFASVRSYLRATGASVGLLLNFAKPTLEVKRVFASPDGIAREEPRASWSDGVPSR